MKTVEELLEVIFAINGLLYCVLSSPIQKEGIHGQKVTIHPIASKEGLLYQVTEQRGPKVFHKNLKSDECRNFLEESFKHHFRHGLLCAAAADYQVLVSKKQTVTILKKPPSRSKLDVTPHNRKKQYLLEEGSPIPFLIALGVMTREGKVIAAKRDKFKQLNRFLELVEDVISHFPKGKKLHIVDFGCGKAYLTFALYHYLVLMHGYAIDIQGLDLKQDVIKHCQALAKELHYEGLNFSVGDINHYTPSGKVDMVISLHACDTATDAALEKAVCWDSEVILCVPCCQHELMRQVKSDVLNPILDHGILKERFAALATDAARAQLLDILGYNTQVLEFIDLEHTPKNLLIRAVKKRKPLNPASQLKAYIAFKNALQISPSLENRFKDKLKLNQV